MISSKFMAEQSMLREIVEKTASRIASEKKAKSLNEIERQAEKTTRIPHDISSDFRHGSVSVIAEIKFASPSEGIISKRSDPVVIAGEYLEAGAKALSVLTEPDFFKGSYLYLQEIREKYPKAKILMKDFFIDPYQIYLAKIIGADAILLIAALFEERELREMIDLSNKLGLKALVEVHDEMEMSRVLHVQPGFIGINNRNLKTMEVNIDTSRRLAKMAGADTILVSESGIKKSEQMKELAFYGFSAFLIGTEPMRDQNPGLVLKNLLKGAT